MHSNPLHFTVHNSLLTGAIMFTVYNLVQIMFQRYSVHTCRNHNTNRLLQGARISGASKIIAIDINSERLEMAKQFGATHTILADKNDTGLMNAAEEVKKMTGSRGADYAFECTAIPALGAAPLAMIRNAGTAVQVSGIEEEITIDMNLFEWDKIYINPLYGKCRPQIDFPKLVSLYDKGDLMLDEMITRTYPLENLQQAFDDMLAGRNAKGVIVFG